MNSVDKKNLKSQAHFHMTSLGGEKKYSSIQKGPTFCATAAEDSRTRPSWYRDEGFSQITMNPKKQRQSSRNYRPKNQLKRRPQGTTVSE